MMNSHRDNYGMTQARRMSQFFTKPQLAQALVDLTRQVLEQRGVKWKDLYFIEPAAGAGAFVHVLPAGRVVGIEADYDLTGGPILYRPLEVGGFLGVTKRDLGLQNIPNSQIVIIGNPPYSQPRYSGRSKNIALEFVQHACTLGDTVAFVLGTTFRRPKTQSKIPRQMRLIYDTDMPSNSYTLDGAEATVATVFQIWKAAPGKRPDDESLSWVKNGHWGGDWYYVKATDSTANIRIRHWGSHATVGTMDPLAEVPLIVASNTGPDNSHFYLHAQNPRRTMQKFARRKHLFEQLARDRTMGNNPDLTLTDLVQIYKQPEHAEYRNGKFIS